MFDVYQNYVSSYFKGSGRLKNKSYQQQVDFGKKNYLKHLPKNSTVKIIDLGCGLGHTLNFLKTVGYKHAEGIDTSQECVDHTLARGFEAQCFDVVDYLQQLPRETVDVFIMSDVLEHQSKERMWQIIDLFQDKLAPDGMVIIKVPNMSNPILGSDSMYLDITHQIGFTANSLKMAFSLKGFTDVTVKAADVYTGGTVLDFLARYVAKGIDTAWYLLALLYGRTTTKIFSKNIIAIVRKTSPDDK